MGVYEVQSWDYLHMMYDGLVAFKEVGGPQSTQLVPDLATSLPKPTNGGKTYTFTLRKGITRSDGSVVKASDFLTSMERLWKAASPSSYFRDIVGATACDAHPSTCNLSKGIVVDNATGKITIHLTHPDGELLDQLALPFAYILPPGLPNIHDLLVLAVHRHDDGAKPALQGVVAGRSAGGQARQDGLQVGHLR